MDHSEIIVRIGFNNDQDYFIRLEDYEAKILARELYSSAEWHGMNKIGSVFWHIASALEGVTNDK